MRLTAKGNAGMRACHLAFTLLLGLGGMALVGIPGGAQAQGQATAQDLVNLMRQMTTLTKDGKVTEAAEVGRKLVATAERIAGKDNPLAATALFALGQVYQMQGKLDEAEATLKRVLAIREKALGPNHAEVAAALDRLGQIAITRGRHAEAERILQRALAVYERAVGADHHDTAMTRVSLGRIRHAEARYGEAEAQFETALAALRKSSLPQVRMLVATVTNNLAVVAQDQGRLALAEARVREALAIQEKILGPESIVIGSYLNNLAEVHVHQGRYAEAEAIHRRALQITEKVLGPDHADVANRLGNLAISLAYQGRVDEAEGLQRRALAIAEKALGPRHPDVASILNNLAHAVGEQDRSAEAEALYRRSLALREAVLGPEHAAVAVSLGNIAGVLFQQRRFEEALPLARRSLAIREKALGPSHPLVAESLNTLGVLLDSLTRHDEAGLLLRRALAIREAALGANHPDLAVSLNNLAQYHQDLRQWKDAYAISKRSYAIWLARRSAMSGAADEGRPIEIRSSAINPYLGIAIAAYHMAEGAPTEVALALRAEAFEAAQWTGSASASAAIARMAARAAAGGGRLGEVVRERQDLVDQAAAIDRTLIAYMSQPDQQRAPTAHETLRRQADDVARRLKEADANLAARFPEYAALVNAGPVPMRDAAGLLRFDEALLLLVPSRHDVYLWAVTRETSRWVKVPLGREALQEHVAALRCGLDHVGAWNGDGARRCMELLKLSSPVGQAGAAPFDLERAHTLYRALFGQIEDVIGGKHLLIVPTGALASFPFHVLVTEPPGSQPPPAGSVSSQPGGDRGLARVESAGEAGRSGERYAAASWLARRHAISVLPSVASLRALRTLARQAQARAPFLGFGNPLLTGPEDSDRRAWERQVCALPRAQVVDTGRRALPTAKLGGGALAEVAALRRQPPLPETADELCAVARLLGAPDTAVYLGASATERRIKAMSASGALGEARFVHFATHGLLAAETERVAPAAAGTRAEPALVLTPPAQASEEDDGLLTASEVAQLKLDADWVILSACNTAAGHNLDAEALSGLARAFFYAGSRALLASHWYVDSDATVALVTGAFAELKRDPGIGRAEALRRAMLALVAQGGRMAHPSSWAPFVVVGEGS
jgi:CHAT domain-containing protein/tetratricopeptide (TPR) repeat protein